MVPEKQKILIADDSEMNRTLLVEMLKDNFEIAEVENGAQALAALQENPGEFSLLLLDIVMPEIDGFEVLTYMQQCHWLDDTPVIMISSEMPELLGICDRIMVMNQGQKKGILDKSEVTEELILQTATM